MNLTQRKFSTAVANFEKALKFSAGDQDIYINLSRAYVSNEQLIKARDILKNGLAHVNDTFSLQRELIDLVKFDNNFVSGHHFANQLKLNERTKVEGFMLQGDLYLLENKREEAINAYRIAGKSGGSREAVQVGLEKAQLLEVLPAKKL